MLQHVCQSDYLIDLGGTHFKMSLQWSRRVQVLVEEEIRKVKELDSPNLGIIASRLLGHKIRAWVVGPPNTEYAGVRLEVELKIPTRYPTMFPTVRFITRVWHPSVSAFTGHINMEALMIIWQRATDEGVKPSLHYFLESLIHIFKV